jgi:hypothetical protein
MQGFYGWLAWPIVCKSYFSAIAVAAYGCQTYFKSAENMT